MLRWARYLVFPLMFACVAGLSASEIVIGSEEGSIILRDGGRKFEYVNIVGSQSGADRSLTKLNGLPALKVISRGNYYFTLLVKGGGVVIDCAYSDVRSIYNGARVGLGICGIDSPLSESFDESAHIYSSGLLDSIYSFSTESIYKTGKGGDFLLGEIGGVEVYDRYSSVESLEGASPQKVIKSSLGCFNFGNSLVFLVFLKGDLKNIKYLDVLRTEEPLRLERLYGEDLRRKAINKCWG